MSITADLIRGHTETIILAHLLDHDSYGYEINRSILKKSDGQYELNEATLYTAFKRLMDAGCITSYWGDGQTGARRKYYTITATGRETYARRLSEWQTAREIIDKLLAREGKSYE